MWECISEGSQVGAWRKAGRSDRLLLVRHNVFQVLSVPFSVCTSVLDPSSSVPYASILIAKMVTGLSSFSPLHSLSPPMWTIGAVRAAENPARCLAGAAPRFGKERAGPRLGIPDGLAATACSVLPSSGTAALAEQKPPIPVKLLPNIWSGNAKRCISFVNTWYMKPYSSVSFPL